MQSQGQGWDLKEGREHNVQPQQREGSAMGRFGMMGNCDSCQESPGLVPACWDDGRAKWSRDVCAVTGRALSSDASAVPQVGLASILAPYFLSKLLELTRARRVTDCHCVIAAHLGVLDHKSAER